jgi:hypothetical protein
MATRVLGPTGSAKRRRFLFVPVVLVAALALFWIAGAQGSAPQSAGVFQLDGNAFSSDTVTGLDGAGSEDWNNICPSTLTGGAAPGCSGPSSIATAQSFVRDGDGTPNKTIFTGGGSKDIYDTPNWAWTDGSVPDKDDLGDAFAAKYTAADTHQYLYFGADRFANNGDSQIGFWFFHKNVAPLANGSFGPDAHTAWTFDAQGHVVNKGDILILSDFTQGGGTPTVRVFFWTANGLLLQAGGTTNPATCTPALALDFCALVNNAAKPSPWPFQAKSGPANTFQPGELYEGGIDATSLGIAGECFSTFLAETRSSQSTSAVLKDFVEGNFQQCQASIKTNASAGVTEQTSVSPGTSVHDLATVTGTGVTPAPDPTSPPNVHFFFCGPTAVDSTATCDSGGTGIGEPTGVPLNGGANTTDGIATAQSGDINTAQSPLAPGRYCFRATWGGDSNYPGAIADSGANTQDECFIVRQIATTTVTTPSDSSGTGLTSPVALGTSLFDKAVVTGTAVGGNPPGTVDFFLCDPTQVTGAAGSEVCASGGTNLSGNPRTLVADANSSPPTSSVLSSPGVVANMAGVWCFRAVYTPTGTTYTGSSDATHGECVTVGTITTTTVTTPSATTTQAVGASVTDHAVVTADASGDGTPTGTINFFICDPIQVAANGGTCSVGGTAAGSKTAVAVANSSPPASSADSDAIIANAVGTWCFRAEYVPGGVNGGNYTGSSDSSTGECFLVQDSTSMESAQDWLPNDTATVTATGGTALNGTMSIQLYEGDSCAAGNEVAGQVYTKTLTNASSAADRTLSTNNLTYKVSVSKSVSWLVSFTPTAGSNVTGSSHCEKTALTITN